MVIKPSISDVDHFRQDRRRIAVLVYDGVTLLDVAGPMDVFNEANVYGPRYELTAVAAAAGPVRTSSGLSFQATTTSGEYDTLIVAGCDGIPECSDQVMDLVRTLQTRSRRIASVCTGSFLLAAAGLLDGRKATTHWRYTNELRRLYPAVGVDTDAIFVRSGDVMTSAGVTSGIDLALALVEEDHGSEAARRVAQALVVYLQRPGGQSQFSTRRSNIGSRGAVANLVSQLEMDPAGPHTATSMADAAGVSVRQLARLFDAEFGVSPTRFLESLRIQTAQQLLLDGVGVTAAAIRSGFGTDETLRRVFLRRLGLRPTDYRRRFRRASVSHSGFPDMETFVTDGRG